MYDAKLNAGFTRVEPRRYLSFSIHTSYSFLRQYDFLCINRPWLGSVVSFLECYCCLCRIGGHLGHIQFFWPEGFVWRFHVAESPPHMPRSCSRRGVFCLLIQAVAKKEAGGATRSPPEALWAGWRAWSRTWHPGLSFDLSVSERSENDHSYRSTSLFIIGTLWSLSLSWFLRCDCQIITFVAFSFLILIFMQCDLLWFSKLLEFHYGDSWWMKYEIIESVWLVK